MEKLSDRGLITVMIGAMAISSLLSHFVSYILDTIMIM